MESIHITGLVPLIERMLSVPFGVNQQNLAQAFFNPYGHHSPYGLGAPHLGDSHVCF